MDIAIQALLAILQAVAPGAPAGLITQIIAALETWVPIIIAEYKALAPVVTNIIAALRSNGVVTPAQLDQLDTMEAALDDAFDAAEAKAEAEDVAKA